jgi:alpha-N-arabinofuranosidase
MSPPIVRWGGCAVDPGNYKWKENVGDRDFRVPFDNWFWGRIEPNDVGIDEFLQFCEAVGAEPMICVSFSDGAESAGHLVHYCNDNADTEWGKKRAANGHLAPYKVKFWQLGNELEDDEYVKGYIDLCKAIKKADPKAVIFASFPSQKLLDSAGQYMDYICPHYYRDDFDNVESEIKGIKDMLKKTAPDRDIKIGVTEWNVTNPWGFERGRLLSLYFALGNARFLNIFHRNSDRVQLACRSNMCNSLCDGAIQTKPSGVLKTAGYYVMKLYTEHSKPVPVAVEGLLEEMDASACRSEDGKSLTLFLVNLKAEPVDIDLDLSEYGAGFKAVEAEMVCDTLDRRQADVMNHWTLPDVIRITKLPVSDKKVTLPAFSVAAIECH